MSEDPLVRGGVLMPRRPLRVVVTETEEGGDVWIAEGDPPARSAPVLEKEDRDEAEFGALKYARMRNLPGVNVYDEDGELDESVRNPNYTGDYYYQGPDGEQYRVDNNASRLNLDRGIRRISGTARSTLERIQGVLRGGWM